VFVAWTASLAGAALGFLRYNFNPARTFMKLRQLLHCFMLAALASSADQTRRA
jgi:hypothetical protein